MLDFTVDENLLMLEILELSPSYMVYLEGQQQNGYSIFGEAFLDRVRAILDEYVLLDESSATTASEPKSGLKKADVLEWFGPTESRNQALIDRLYNIRRKLSTLLNISSSMLNSGLSSGYQGTPIKKG